jgi:hypothetical protein
MGRPTAFRPEFVEQARRLCLLGHTNEDLAKFFGVGLATLNRWISVQEAFRDAMKEGRQVADARVAESLYRRACGYEHDDIDIRVVKGKIRKTKIRRYYPPDTASCIIWLKNRQRAHWRDRIDPTAPGADDLPPPVKIVVQVEDASVRPEPEAE